MDKLRQQMTLGGYTHVTQVVSQGEFAVRGGIIDIFPTGGTLPVRLDLMTKSNRSRRSSRIRNARCTRSMNPSLLPAREFPTDEAGRTQFRQRFREVFEGDLPKSAVYKDVSNGITLPGGIEFYLPLFFDSAETLFDHAPTDSVFAMLGDVHGVLTDFEKENTRTLGFAAWRQRATAT